MKKSKKPTLPLAEQSLGRHFRKIRLQDLVTASRTFPIAARVDVQRALEKLFASRPGHQLLGVHTQFHHETMTIAHLMGNAHYPVVIGPLQHIETELMKQIIPAEIMCPAAGQGALGIEIRQGDAATRQHLAFLNDPAARAATTCERALLSSLGGGCQVPIGAFAEMRNGKLHLESIVADPDGSKLLRDSRDGDDPESLGNAAGAALLARGGDQILEAVYGRGLAVPPQP